MLLLVQAVLSRAELLLASGCSHAPALEAASGAIEAVVGAWATLEAEEAEKKRKEAEILKYKMQEHVVRGWSHTYSRTCFFLFVTCGLSNVGR